MYIACYKYKEENHLRAIRMPVFDTNDCTVECVDIKEAKALFEIRNITVKNGAVVRGFGDIRNSLPKDRKNYVRSDEDLDIFYVGSKEIYFTSTSNEFILNHKLLPEITEFHELAYMFEFRGYLILRFNAPFIHRWFTCALKDDKIDYWSQDFSICTNKKLATLVDTTLEV